MPEIVAQLNYLRISPRKVRAVADILKGLDIDAAQSQLKYTVRKPAKPLLKLLNSAVSNAQHNFGLDKNYLYIKEITVNEGVRLKRYKPKGFGLAMPIQKRTSRVKIVLDELSGKRKKRREAILAKMPKIEKTKPGEAAKRMEEKPESIKAKAETRPKVERKKGVVRRGAFGGIKSLSRRLFRRKAV